MKLGFSTLALNIALVGAVAPAALAQNRNDNPFFRHRFIAVTERQQPQYDPQPLHWGSFNAMTSMTLGAKYNDNIYALPNNEKGDTIITLAPQIDLSSNWTKNALNAGVAVDREQYVSKDAESTTNYNGYVNGRLDVTRSFWVGGQAAGGRFTEPRYAPSDSTNAAEPTHYDHSDFEAQTSYRFSRVQVDAQAGSAKDDYHSVRLNGGGTLNQDFRDVTDNYVNGRASYAVSPDVAFFVQGKYSDFNYDHPIALTPSRDNTQTYVQGGTSFELAAPFRGDIALGYLKEDKDAPIVPGGSTKFDGFSADGHLMWFPTEITTVTLTGRRSVFDPGLLNSSVAFDELLGVRIDHELRRNIVLFGTVDHGQVDFQDIDRKDDYTDFGVGAGYKLNRHARIDLSYTLRDQNSKGAQRDRDLDQNIVSLALKIYP